VLRRGIGTEVRQRGQGGPERLDRIVEREAWGVGLAEKLGGRLSVVTDLRLRRFLEDGVVDSVHIYRSFVGEVVKNVPRSFRGGAALLPAKDQVDPFV
jgi:hypothetical protein